MTDPTTPTEADAKLSGEAGRPCCDVDGCSEPAAVDDRGFRLQGQSYSAAYCREHANAMDASIRKDPTP